MTEQDHDAFEAKQKRLDGFRGSGVGTEDPNIVGHVGPTGVPPGADVEDPEAPSGEELEADDAAPGAADDAVEPG